MLRKHPELFGGILEVDMSTPLRLTERMAKGIHTREYKIQPLQHSVLFGSSSLLWT